MRCLCSGSTLTGMSSNNGQTSPNRQSPNGRSKSSKNGAGSAGLASMNGRSTNSLNSFNGHSANSHRLPGGGRFTPPRYAHIVGWGMEVPERVITNKDLEAVVDTTDEWIRTRTGIHERRFASEKETVTSMGFEAARRALDRADVLPSEIELIVVATSTPENFYPSTACQIQNLLGATKAGAFDLSAACSGFVYAMNMAAQAIRSGSIETALVIGTETNSRVMDWDDRSTCILFGDGAGAVVLRGSEQPGGVLSCVLGSDGSGGDLLGIPTVGQTTLPDGRLLHKLHMDGREVFRFATHIINESIREALEKAGLTLADVAMIVPHQANQRIIAAAARSLNLSESLFYSNIHRYGNTSAASIPIALCEAEKEGRMKPNDHLVLIGFGGGLTWGAMVVQWQSISLKPPTGLRYRLSAGRREAEYVLAFWRAHVMRVYRRVEAAIRGPATKPSNFRKTRKLDARSSQTAPKVQTGEHEKV